MSTSPIQKWILFFIAASAALALVVFAWNAIHSAEQPPNSPHHPITPGSDRAVLTLSDGRQLTLTDTSEQKINDNGADIRVGKGIVNCSHSRVSVNNTLTTPRGGQYRITLPDGSDAWLNAASSISYPTIFIGGKRIVRIAGEVYFEVKRDPRHPFIVQTYREPVQVLGTSFNVNCYFDETFIKISLIEGSIKVHSYTMLPGEGYSYGDLVKTNVLQDIAWTKGNFGFDHTDLEAVMRQVARWYDVEIAYPNGAPAKYITGTLNRKLSAAELIAALKELGITARFTNDQLLSVF